MEITVEDAGKGNSIQDFADSRYPEMAGKAIAARINDKLVDLTAALEEGRLELLTWEDERAREVYRHTASHIMAQAVMELFPGAKLGFGPAIADGFYYDFDLASSLSPEDLEAVEERMREITKRDLPIVREIWGRNDAIRFFKESGQDYKVELLADIEDAEVSIYRQGEFVDLCRGPHLTSTGRLRYFKLLNLAGAYWRGDEKRPMLQRIYGTAFYDQGELDAHIYMLSEAERRDHRRIGRELDLFSFHEEAGPGVVFYHPKGAVQREIIEGFLKEEHRKRGYDMVVTPHLFKGQLWHESGHLDYYAENMYTFEKDGVEYVVKPMNCPGHILIYRSQPRSYRDLPLKFFELGTVYRYERSGVLHGLLRVRGFTQDDAHVFCTEEQLEEQIRECLEFAFFSLRTFGFEDFEVFLSTRPEGSVGSEEQWDKATDALAKALEHLGINYQVDPGEGVFYGPKIDIKLRDAIGRLWQGPTVQADFNLPERFGITYTGADNQPHRPAMIHRVVLAGIERFYGILIEHYAGEFPMWLAPVQIILIPVADRHLPYARELEELFRAEGLRVEVDDDSQTVNMKIRKAQMQKVPLSVVVGDREVEAGTVSARDRSGHDIRGMDREQFLTAALRSVREKTLSIDWEA
ncbi:MAG: threonine--tRNA ligase [Actinobacteria bacterium RBG_19FT_COMBO_54_7]|uniref:Threonine--tRNA ligase n=1 Tax=Candidatus Solincola sediminis TaxID=1797199 RepID=A0A1F2WJH4_9ACTN|nr:MAG: threonine--tRNA ligase [Candidatus Solincola sediminis]OFW70616.1 MAG: threonine--tRNA ligase [Actinobacteria bacterium RBG_19FT_COMBO_54_7]